MLKANFFANISLKSKFSKYLILLFLLVAKSPFAQDEIEIEIDEIHQKECESVANNVKLLAQDFNLIKNTQAEILDELKGICKLTESDEKSAITEINCDFQQGIGNIQLFYDDELSYNSIGVAELSPFCQEQISKAISEQLGTPEKITLDENATEETFVTIAEEDELNTALFWLSDFKLPFSVPDEGLAEIDGELPPQAFAGLILRSNADGQLILLSLIHI